MNVEAIQDEKNSVVDVIKKKDYMPSLEMVKVNHYGKIIDVPQIVLSPKNAGTKYVLQGRPFSKFLTFIKVRKSKLVPQIRATLRKGEGIETHNKYIQNKYPKSPTKKFQILHTNGIVTRFTSNKYMSVDQEFIQKTIEDRLTAEGIRFEKEIKFDGINGIYKLLNAVTEGSEIAKTVSYINKNNGDKSLRFYGGAVVIVCSNGMISNNSTSEIKLKHMKTNTEIAREINKHIGAILENLDVLPEKVFKLREIEVTKTQARKRINALPIPQYMQKAIWKRLFTKSDKTMNGKMDWDGTLYGIYMASTYIGSNVETIKKSKNRKEEINESHAEILQNFELITTDYTGKVPIPVAI